MSFLAAMFLLNLDAGDAFVAFANLLNRPCQMAFFMVDQPMVCHTFFILLKLSFLSPKVTKFLLLLLFFFYEDEISDHYCY